MAGGAVRDLLMGREANDIDLATSATPDQVENLFEKTVMVGRVFGVSRVILNGQDIEVATFRKDGPYLDGRKPESVEFCSELEDAKRRDFTINGMFYDPQKSELIDHVGGQKDVMQKIIRAIGEPAQRFTEDKLRILRGLRFHGQLGFSIEPETLKGIKDKAENINQVSTERIRDEWEKLILSPHAPLALQKSMETGLWSQLFADWKYQGAVYKKHFSDSKHSIEKAWVLWFLIHISSSIEEVAESCLQWKLSKKLSQKMIYCFQSLKQLGNIERLEPVDVAIYLNKPYSPLAVDVFKELHGKELKPSWHGKIREAKKYFVGNALPERLVNGDDLMNYGVSPGPQIAEGLRKLYRYQIQHKLKDKEELLKKLPQLL